MTPIVDAPQPVVLVGGAEIAPEVVNILRMLTDIFVAADGGAEHLRTFGLHPTKVIGDLDSLSERSRQEFAPQLVHVAELPRLR